MERKSDKGKEVKPKVEPGKNQAPLTLIDIKKLNQQAQKYLADLQSSDDQKAPMGWDLERFQYALKPGWADSKEQSFNRRMYREMETINRLNVILQQIRQALNHSKNKLDNKELSQIENEWIKHVQEMCKQVKFFIQYAQLFNARQKNIITKNNNFLKNISPMCQNKCLEIIQHFLGNSRKI